MKNKLNNFKRKFGVFVEKLMMSEHDFFVMKTKSKTYDAMMSSISCSIETDYEEIKNHGRIIVSFPKSKTATINIDVRKMLNNCVVTIDNSANINIIGDV